MSDQDSKVSEFISVTGVDRERAVFYLQSANWELHTALGTFYDNDSGEVMEQGDATEEVDEVQIDESRSSSSAAAADTRQKNMTQTGGSRLATLAQYQNISSDDDDKEAFYAGGSERSGQQILDPRKKKKNITQDLFNAAKEHGAEAVQDESSSSSGSKKKNRNVFMGAGYTLGSEVQPSQQVGASLKPEDFQSKDPKNVKIKFWKNGFSVDNGPLRTFDDPANSDFLDSIKKGEAPLELRRQVHNGEVHVDMEDHRDEEFVKQKETLKAFSGAGHMLGSPSPTIVQSPVPEAACHIPKQPTFKPDESKPLTTIQIRLSDGTRLVSKFNHDNTIADIRTLVQNARPNTGSFNLMTTFPNKVLNDDSMTIAEAKLLNAVIVQRLT